MGELKRIRTRLTKEEGDDWIMPFGGNERIENVKLGDLDFAFNKDGEAWIKAMRNMTIDLKIVGISSVELC